MHEQSLHEDIFDCRFSGVLGGKPFACDIMIQRGNDSGLEFAGVARDPWHVMHIHRGCDSLRACTLVLNVDPPFELFSLVALAICELRFYYIMQ
jgi:hypothetical protein